MHPSSSPQSMDIHYRPQPIVRQTSTPRLTPSSSRVHLNPPYAPPRFSRPPSLRSTPSYDGYSAGSEPNGTTSATSTSDAAPTICGLPLKYVSLVTLAVQNAALSIVMHYSRVSTPPSRSYSPASAVLLNEILKGTISFIVAVVRQRDQHTVPPTSRKSLNGPTGPSLSWASSIRRVNSEIFSHDCWKLSIPAILYVIQNSLQFVAVSNLPVASFQVTYQMKILTTAAFSVAMLGKRLSSTKWLALLFLAMGVGIVQIQTSSIHSATVLSARPAQVGSAAAAAPIHMHIMHPLKGFAAVSAACFTSGLAGVYFEMVLKNSKSDLWVRNVQLSLFSIIPAFLPILYSSPPDSRGMFVDLFKNFGTWAWGTVAIQVLGGLITAIVIKYSDNIMKGFATSLSIILSFLASVALFDFRITPAFVLGSSTVLAATWMYNQPPSRDNSITTTAKNSPFLASPKGADSPIIGHVSEKVDSRRSSPYGSPQSISSVLRPDGSHQENGNFFGGESKTYLFPPYGSPFPSRTPSPSSTVPSTPPAAQKPLLAPVEWRT